MKQINPYLIDSMLPEGKSDQCKKSYKKLPGSEEFLLGHSKSLEPQSSYWMKRWAWLIVVFFVSFLIITETVWILDFAKKLKDRFLWLKKKRHPSWRSTSFLISNLVWEPEIWDEIFWLPRIYSSPGTSATIGSLSLFFGTGFARAVSRLTKLRCTSI